MTRAESRLIVCGPHVGRENAKLKDGCWYDWVKRGLEALEASAYPAPFEREVNGELVTGLRYGAQPKPAAANDKGEDAQSVNLPPWINQNAAPETGGRRRVTPLLEILPEIAEIRRRETADKMLSGYTDLPPDLAAQIKDEVFAVLEHADFVFECAN